jgi:hypothetical protein
MSVDTIRPYAKADVDDRIEVINNTIELEEEKQERGVYHMDYEYRMSDARIRALKTERDTLKEIRGDL